MSIDRSLRGRSSLSRHRNVLSRAERIEILQDHDKWDEAKSTALGLPKVPNRKIVTGKKKARGAEGEEEKK